MTRMEKGKMLGFGEGVGLPTAQLILERREED